MRSPALAAFTMAAVLPLTGLAATGTAVAQSSAAQSSAARSVPIDECANVPPVRDPGADRYLCSRPELGPVVLPADPVLKPLLVDYDRLGGVTPARFLDWYRDWRGWLYPDHNGFVDNGGNLDMTEVDLTAGKKLDRFGGNERGRFLAPGGTPFAQRALPPDSLNGGEANYHCFEVQRSFKVQQGHIAGAFSQPGYGLQQWLDPDLKPNDPKLKTFDVAGLLDAGYLSEHKDKGFCQTKSHGS